MFLYFIDFDYTPGFDWSSCIKLNVHNFQCYLNVLSMLLWWYVSKIVTILCMYTLLAILHVALLRLKVQSNHAKFTYICKTATKYIYICTNGCTGWTRDVPGIITPSQNILKKKVVRYSCHLLILYWCTYVFMFLCELLLIRKTLLYAISLSWHHQPLNLHSLKRTHTHHEWECMKFRSTR